MGKRAQAGRFAAVLLGGIRLVPLVVPVAHDSQTLRKSGDSSH